MAGQLLRYGDHANVGVMEFVVDSEDELQFLPTMAQPGTNMFSNVGFAPIGSTCIVGNGEGEDISIYMLFSSGWKKL